MNIHNISKQIRAFADQLDATKASEQPAPFTLPIQTLVADQVTATPEMQDAASRVLAEELQLDPDDGPPWIEHKGGPCPLNDDKVEEFQIKWSYGSIHDYDIPPSTLHGWEKDRYSNRVEAYRVLKARKPDDSPPWIEHKGGPCPLNDEVEEWEFLFRDGDTSKILHARPASLRWTHVGDSSDIIAYRVLKAKKPTPKQPLGPQDVPPGSVLLSSSGNANGMQWIQVLWVKARGVEINGRDCITWAELKEHWKINRPRHRDENGNPTLWEACER
jgi:hypothetical protein